MWGWIDEKQDGKDRLQESIQCWQKGVQAQWIVEVDESFHASEKELEGHGIHAVQEGHQIVQGSHAPLQGLKNLLLFHYIFHVFILTRENVLLN